MNPAPLLLNGLLNGLPGSPNTRTIVALLRYRHVAYRQVPRLRFVGSNPVTRPVIEAGPMRVLQALAAHFRQHRFLMGVRPGASDFAVCGQLTQRLGFDPTPIALAQQHAPRVRAWNPLVKDLGGIEAADDGWLDARPLRPALRALLVQAGRLYVPLLLANARALAAGQTGLHAVIDGQPWVQPAFPYQGKCLTWLRRGYRALEPARRARVDEALAGTGCEALLPDLSN